MRILLVGGNSSVAQALRPMLASIGESLTAGRSGCDVELDLAWPAERFEIPANVDVVINLAAHFCGSTVTCLLAAEEINVLGVLKLAQACTRSGVKQLVQISTIFAGLAENSPFYSGYAVSKRHAEEVLQLYCRQTGLRLAILRLAQIYGEGERFRQHQPFLYAILDQAQCGCDIVLQGSNDAQRNFMHIEDVTEIITRVVSQRIVGRYVCASLANVRFSEIAAAAVAAVGGVNLVYFDAGKPDVPDNAFEADETLYRLIDYYPRVSMQQGFAREVRRRRAGS